MSCGKAIASRRVRRSQAPPGRRGLESACSRAELTMHELVGRSIACDRPCSRCGGSRLWSSERRVSSGGGGRVIPAPAARSVGRLPADPADRGDRRRLLLGRAGRVPARRGRRKARLRLRRRRQGERPTTRRSAAARTGHAESVQIAFDPQGDHLRRRSCRCISRWRTTRPNSTARAPTSARSTARRSSPPTREQAKIAKAYIAQLDTGARCSRADRHHASSR